MIKHTINEQEPTGIIKTNNQQLNMILNSIIQALGKEAAIKYLQYFQGSTTKPTGQPTTANPTNVTASDGESYTLSDDGKGTPHSRIWLDKNGKEASRRIDRELESKYGRPSPSNPQPQPQPQPQHNQNNTAQPSQQNSAAYKQGFQQRAMAARNTKARPMREDDGFDLFDLIETASGGATSAGGIASVANSIGGVISRTPNLFGYIPSQPQHKIKKRKNKYKNAH